MRCEHPVAGYQKGVVPKYLRSRKEQEQRADGTGVATDEEPACPPGHVTLPDTERKETLRMLRNSTLSYYNIYIAWLFILEILQDKFVTHLKKVLAS